VVCDKEEGRRGGIETRQGVSKVAGVGVLTMIIMMVMMMRRREIGPKFDSRDSS